MTYPDGLVKILHALQVPFDEQTDTIKFNEQQIRTYTTSLQASIARDLVSVIAQTLQTYLKQVENPDEPHT